MISTPAGSLALVPHLSTSAIKEWAVAGKLCVKLNFVRKNNELLIPWTSLRILWP